MGSESQKRYLNKIRNTTKFQFSVTISRKYKEDIENYVKLYNLDKTKLFLRMLEYCIYNNADFETFVKKQNNNNDK